jgi:hypothetical protein
MLPRLLTSIFLSLCLPVIAAPPLREAPNPTARPANQLVVAGNACGPTALLNAFRFGSVHWQRASGAIAGETDKQQVHTLIRESGMLPSRHIKGQTRWSRKGVNLLDLRDIANERCAGHFLPEIKEEVLFLNPRESQEKLLARVHQRFETSLAKGLPPVISLRRYALRGPAGKQQWVILDAHFVTLISVPRKLAKGAREFPVTYIDPWGGKICQGSVVIPARGILADAASASPCLEANFPLASVGIKQVRPGESHALSLAAALGRW